MSTAARAALPYIDEQAAVVAAGPDAVWPALLRTVERAFSRPGPVTFARVVGCRETRASGPRPLAGGATIPGFRVAAAVPGSQLALVGRHRLATYVLTFRLQELPAGGTRLSAESRAAFPGAAGAAYRLLVVGSRLHVVAVRRLLRAVARAAERG